MMCLNKIRTTYVLTVLLSLLGCVNQRTVQRPFYQLPMYGGVEKSPEVKKADQEFIDICVKEFGSCDKASIDAAERGWKYFYQNDYNTALSRFNQSWMLNPGNASALWGFGVIMGQRASQENHEVCLKESIKFLLMAREKDSLNGRIVGDLAHAHTILGHYYRSLAKKMIEAQDHFDKAGVLYQEAYHAEPDYPPIVANWSIYYFYAGYYALAKIKADKALGMGYQFTPEYIRDLQKHLK